MIINATGKINSYIRVTFGKISLETNKIEVLKDTEEPLSLNLQKIFSEARNQYK